MIETFILVGAFITLLFFIERAVRQFHIIRSGYTITIDKLCEYADDGVNSHPVKLVTDAGGAKYVIKSMKFIKLYMYSAGAMAAMYVLGIAVGIFI